MKIVAILNENGFCVGYELSYSSDGIVISYADARSGLFDGRKYDKQNKKWLDEYDEELRYLVRSLELPNYIVLQLLESNMIENEYKIKEIDDKTLSLQEATATMYEEQSAYKLQMQEAIATLYEKIVELQGGQ